MDSIPTHHLSKTRTNTAFVVSDVCGDRAGAYVATLLLCRELVRAGMRVVCYSAIVLPADITAGEGFSMVRPLLKRGWKHDWPVRSLIWKVRRDARRDVPEVIIVVGVTRIAGYLLKSWMAGRLLIWELTNANPNNKYVDGGAVKRLGSCRAVLSPSRSIDDQIQRSYAYSGPLWRLPFWIEEAEQNQLATGTGNDFIFLGRRDVDKGLAEIVEATARLAAVNPGLSVMVGGIGSSEPFEALSRQLRVEPNLGFHSFESRSDAMQALRNSKWLLLPSYHEGYPLVILEAFRAGVPVIASSVGSIPEMLGESGAGLLVPPRNAHALAEAMEKALNESRDEYARRREAARARFQALSSSEAICAQLSRVLQLSGARAE